MRKYLLVISLAALALTVGACGKKDGKKADGKGGMSAASDFNCESLTKKNKECANELSAAFLESLGDKLPAELKQKLASRMKERFSSNKWLEGCKKRWDSDKLRHKAQKEAMEKCFPIAGCKEYAKCFASSMGKGRRRRGMGPRSDMAAPADMAAPTDMAAPADMAAPPAKP